MNKQYFNRSQWIRFRAEQLALRNDGLAFLTLYKKRSVTFGFEGYVEANQAFRNFLQPYITEARRAWEAEKQAWYENQYVASNKNVTAKPYVEDDEDENDECEQCGAVIGKGDELCNDCDAEISHPEYGEKS